MKIKYFAFLALALTLSLTGCMDDNKPQQQQQNTSIPENSESDNSATTTTTTNSDSTTSSSNSDSTGATQTVSSDNFSYNVPSDWKVMDVPGTNFKTAMSASSHSNINVVSQPYEGQLSEYVDMSLKQVETTFKNFKKVSQGPFKTESGLEGLKIVTDNNVTGQNIRQVMYFLKGDGNMTYVITCTALAAEAEKAESLFDNCVKTFTLKK